MRRFKYYNKTNRVLATLKFNACKLQLTYPPIIEKAHQLVGSNFPKDYGKKLVACSELIMRAKSAEDAFATRGFQNWRLIATTVFRQHELGAFHKEAVEREIALLEAIYN